MVSSRSHSSVTWMQGPIVIRTGRGDAGDQDRGSDKARPRGEERPEVVKVMSGPRGIEAGDESLVGEE